MRPRRSTVIVALAFLAVFALYLGVRPEPEPPVPAGYVRDPATSTTTVPARTPVTRPVPTTTTTRPTTSTTAPRSTTSTTEDPSTTGSTTTSTSEPGGTATP